MNQAAIADDKVRELTLRAVILGALITVVFTATNVYLGLKVGLTFASSIPAAVISMAVLRLATGSNIRENNIVQTIASAAGTLSSIIFVLPGLIMVGYWTGFPFWQSAAICGIGGILGVMFSVPLRRAMVVNGDLPYPEGVAAAEILKVGSTGDVDAPGKSPVNGGAGLRDIITGSVVAAVFQLLTAIKLFGAEFKLWFSFGSSVTSLGTGLGLALVGVGNLVGIAVGVAMLTGIFIGWGVAMPILTSLTPIPEGVDIAAYGAGIWRTKVRVLGAGSIAVAAIWSLILLSRPMLKGIQSSIEAVRQIKRHGAASIPRTERDIPINTVALVSVLMLLPMAVSIWYFVGTAGSAVSAYTPMLIGGGIVFAIVMGFLVASACGYMAGLVGSSNSPVSGLGIIAVVTASSLLVGLFGSMLEDEAVRFAAVACALFATATILPIATIANDNLQDLKTGYLVGATPSRQQWALVIGVLVGAIIIPPVLNLMQEAYGFAGAPLARPDMDPAKVLAAPQATLMSSLAKGILGGSLEWNLLGIGALVGLGLVVFNEVLKRIRPGLHLPPLAVSLAIYLPVDVNVPIIIGAIVTWFAERAIVRRARAQGRKEDDTAILEVPRRHGVLLSSGLIVGEGLVGVAVASIIVVTGNQEPLGLLPNSFAHAAEYMGLAGFVLCCYGLRRWLIGAAK